MLTFHCSIFLTVPFRSADQGVRQKVGAYTLFMNRNTYNLYDAIDRARKRPGMYIGDEKLKNMHSYIAGYQAAMIDVQIEDVSQPNIYGFHEWIRKRFDYSESTAGWSNMIFAAMLGYKPENVNWETYHEGATTDQHREYIVKKPNQAVQLDNLNDGCLAVSPCSTLPQDIHRLNFR